MLFVALFGSEKSFAYCRRMMSKIIYDRNTAFNAANLHTSFHAFKFWHCFVNNFAVEAQTLAGSDYAQAVTYIKDTDKRRLINAKFYTLNRNSKGGHFACEVYIFRLPFCAFVCAERLHIAKPLCRKLSHDGRIPTRN